MHFKKSSDHTPYSGSRFETTYGSSYNKGYNYPNKLNTLKLPDNTIHTNIVDVRQKPESVNNLQISKTANRLNTDSPVKFLNPPLSSFNSKVTKDNFNQQKLPEPESLKQFDYNHMMTQIAKITDNLYLSSMHAITPDRLKSLGITLVVSLMAENSNIRLPSAIERLQINIEDTENANIRRHFDKALERMNLEERRHGRMLVHCVAGISRSSTVVIAYLMRHHNKRLREAYDQVRSQRPYIQPNLGFWRQLIEYERSIFGTATVNMVPLEGSRILVPDVTPSILADIIAVTPMLRMQTRQPLSGFPVRSTYTY